MTLPQIIRTFGWGVVLVMAPVAAWVAVTDVGRPYRATCYSAKPEPCFAVSALSGEYQAQGRGK